MKRVAWLTAVFGVLLMMPCPAAAQGSPAVYIYVDAAPNAYGEAGYPAWQAAAFAAASTGTFVNMANGTIPCNVGTTNFEIEDDTVYSFGDLGKRLTWVYWIPGYTKAQLTGAIEVALFNTWDGDVLDFYDDYYGSTWLVPSKISDYDADADGDIDGVVGVAGMAWWGAYGVNTPEALESDLAAWGASRESWDFQVKLFGTVYTHTSNRKPVRLTTLFSQCATGAKNAGKFLSCVSAQTNDLKKKGLLTGSEKGYIQSCAAASCAPSKAK